MIILEQPFVSEFLQKTIAKNNIPVLETDFVKKLKHANELKLLKPKDFFEKFSNSAEKLLYTNSEDSTKWLNQYAPDLEITKHTDDLKNKERLREIFAKKNPKIWFKSYSIDELCEIDLTEIPKPFVIKPKKGFASICIHPVFSDNDWKPVLKKIEKERKEMQDVFPDSVVSLDEFLIESYIDGKEIAVDAYLNETGKPVILNIFHHLSSSKFDMSDRLYLTSDEIIRKYYAAIVDYLSELSKTTGLTKFPLHIELRVTSDERIIPIEINPLRFMGFCSADVEYYFYGINPYEYFFQQKEPNWDTILQSRTNKLYGMMGIEIPKHYDKNTIVFDYDKVISHFSKPLHYIKLDYTKYPMAMFVFAEVEKSNFEEFNTILHSDLAEYIYEK